MATEELATPTDHKGRAPANLPLTVLGRGHDSIIVNVVVARRGGGRVLGATGRVAGGCIAGALSFPDPDCEIVEAVIDLAVDIYAGVPLHYCTKVSENAPKGWYL